MIQINLLPWREQHRKKRQTRFFFIIGMMVGLGFFVTLFFHMHYSAKIKAQLQRNALLNASLEEQSMSLSALNKKDRELALVTDQLKFIYNLRATSYQAVRILNELTIANPEAVTLYKITRVGNKVTVDGKAKSNLQVTQFMDNIEKSPYFKQPVLTDISGKDNLSGDDRIFQLKIEQRG